MDVAIRPIGPKEYPAARRVLAVAFGLPEPGEERLQAALKVTDLSRVLAVLDGGEIVGVGGAHPFTMTVPGGTAPTAGVAMVGVLPSHRRRGILTQLMHRILQDALDRGECLAALWSSEDQIYQRFGFGLASAQGQVEIARDRAALLDPGPPVGRVRLVAVERRR